MANNKSVSMKTENHDTINHYFHSDPQVENSEAYEDLTVTLNDKGLDDTETFEDGSSYVESHTWLPDGTEVVITLGVCEDGTGEHASYIIEVGEVVGPGAINEWDKAYTADELPDMWVDFEADLEKVISEHSANESKKSEGLPPKRLGSKRQYRSRADLINKMKQLGAVEITTSKQFNDIKNSQWLHTAGYALDTNGNLVAQSYYGDKDGKWYYTSTRNFDSDYLPESKQHENRTKEEEVTNIFKGMKEWADRWSNSDKDRKSIADNLDLEAVQENMSDIVEILDGKFEWDGYGFKFPVAFDYSEEDDGARDAADADQWNTCYDACAEIAELIGIPDDGNTIGAMNEYFWEEVEQTWSSNESKSAESKQSNAFISDWQDKVVKGLEAVKDDYGFDIEYDEIKDSHRGTDAAYTIFVKRNELSQQLGTVGTNYFHTYTDDDFDRSVPYYAKDYTPEEAVNKLLSVVKGYCARNDWTRKAESKKSESLSLKQKELKDMVRYGEAEDITTISDAEAKELRKKGIELVGVSRGTYGMNGALLRDNEGKKYAITARSSNLFYFV